MKGSLAAIRIYSPKDRRIQKAQQRKRDLEHAAAGQAQQVQTRNRLISNPKEWRLELPDDIVNE